MVLTVKQLKDRDLEGPFEYLHIINTPFITYQNGSKWKVVFYLEFFQKNIF